MQAAISAYNTSPHASSGFSPYEANFGRVPVTLTDVMLDPQPVEQAKEKLNDYVSRIKSNAEVINRKINDNLNEAHKRQKEQYDRFINSKSEFQVDELVLVVNERNIVGQSKSFKERATGPFRILQKFNEVNYKLMSLANGKIHVVHYNRLKKYNSRKNIEVGKQIIFEEKSSEQVVELKGCDPFGEMFWYLISLD